MGLCIAWPAVFLGLCGAQPLWVCLTLRQLRVVGPSPAHNPVDNRTRHYSQIISLAMAPDLQPDAQAFTRRVCEVLGDNQVRSVV